ncbi:MAG: S8 family serine peptidase, partial [Wenzhouxiangella sp.]
MRKLFATLSIHSAAVLLACGFLAGPLAVQAQTLQAESANLNQPFSPADEQGRFVYLIEYAEPGLLQRGLRGSSQPLDFQSPATQGALTDLQAVQQQHLQTIAGTIRRSPQVSHYYLATHSGMAMRLTPQEAAQVAALPQVVAIERERVYELSTFRGPEFIGADAIWGGSAVPDGSPLQGEGMVAAILDTGVDPNHPSFANDLACGHGQNGTPDKLISFLDCQSTDGIGLCNGPSPQDNDSHGSHVASTVAGNRLDNNTVPSPNVPPPFTEISGVAPCAHIRSYHVCQPGGCPGADVQAGMDSVLIHGDVDVMNFSISGGTNPWNDNDRRKLDLVDAGVFVAASAGNTTATITNPVGAVGHRGPWVMSVAASTHDGEVEGTVSITGPGTPPGNTQDISMDRGSASPIGSPLSGHPILRDTAQPPGADGCNPGFAPDFFDGAIALIQRGTCPFTEKINNAATAGADLVIIWNNVAAPISMTTTDQDPNTPAY